MVKLRSTLQGVRLCIDYILCKLTRWTAMCNVLPLLLEVDGACGVCFHVGGGGGGMEGGGGAPP